MLLHGGIIIHGVKKVSNAIDAEQEAIEFTRIFARLMAGPLQRHALTLSKGEFGLLMALTECGRPMTGTELAEELCIGPSGVANLLKRLEKKGYVNREICAEDHRANNITITGAGQICLDARFDQVKRSAMVYINEIDPAAVHNFNVVLRQLLELSRSINLPD